MRGRQVGIRLKMFTDLVTVKRRMPIRQQDQRIPKRTRPQPAASLQMLATCNTIECELHLENINL
jgi:hypothetical protein